MKSLRGNGSFRYARFSGVKTSPVAFSGPGQIPIGPFRLHRQAPPRLSAQFELLRYCVITTYIRIVQIIQQAPPLADHHQQPPTRTVIFLVGLQVFRQMIDPLRKQRDLHVGRTGIFFVQFEIVDHLCFGFHSIPEFVKPTLIIDL